MNLSIRPRAVTNIDEFGVVTSAEFDGYTLQIFDRDGNLIIEADELTVPETPVTGVIKDNNTYGVPFTWQKVGNYININIEIPYIFNSVALSVKVLYANHRTYFNSFVLYGYDLTLPVYLAPTSMDTETMASFIEIANPLENIKYLYNTNSFNFTSRSYYINDVAHNGNNITKQINDNSTVYLRSTYRYNVGGIVTTVTHTSTTENLYFYQFNPEINIIKDINKKNVLLEDTVSIIPIVDFTNQIKFTIDRNSVNLGLDFSVEVNVYTRGGILVSTDIQTKTLSRTEEVDNWIGEAFDVTLPESGEYSITATYKILGRYIGLSLLTYPIGTYIVMWDAEGLHSLGDVVTLTEPIAVSSSITLLPALVNDDQLKDYSYYAEPYTSEVFATVNQVGLYFEGSVITIGENERVVEVSSFYNYAVSDSLIVLEKFSLLETGVGEYTLTNLTSETIDYELYKMNNQTFEIVTELVEVEDSIAITLADGVYKFKVTDGTENYIKEVILVSYPTLLLKEIDFISMLINDCVGSNIDYRTFYDFTAFGFLSNIFYRMLNNQQNFSYIYNDQITTELLQDLYMMDDILSRITEYTATYVRQNS